MRGRFKVCLVIAALAALLPATAFAQNGSIAGTVRDAQGGVMPGVLVEVTSPNLIEKVRSTTTDGNGQYRLTNLPVGTYSVTFALEGFNKSQQNNIVLSTDFTAPVNATMTVGQLAETLVVSAEAPAVDVQNARQAVTFEGEALRELPTARNINSLLNLTPGISSRYAPSGAFGAPGVCVGGVGTFCNPGLDGFNVGDSEDGTTRAQGRVMVDGQVVNSGTALPLGGQTGGYTADIANAQEVNIQLSGALGESETGGASINIVPRTGGNRYAGEFNTTYTRGGWFDRNTENYASVPALFQAVISDHDVSGAYGGPIKRDRLWFYSVARDQGIHKLPVGIDFWPNLHEGKYGWNYQPDRSKPRVEYKNMWKNVNARITWQATQKNKFNIFWDEQDFCQDPCLGVVSVFTSPESWFSVQLRPNRLQQVSWTNPLTNKILLDAGLSASTVEYNTTEHREYTNHVDVPRITENGNTAGGDDVAARVNIFAGGPGFGLTSGSLNGALAGGGAEIRKTQSYRTRASVAYVTGSHNAKLGYEGGYFTQEQTNGINESQFSYNYNQPATSCLTNTNPLACGQLLAAQFPNDPFNRTLRPVPANFVYHTGQGTVQDQVMYASVYLQDQWTLKRLTISGAVRYDHATSSYPETTVGPNKFVPTQANGDNFYTIPEWEGVKYNDFTPRWGVAWDIFGNGKTSLKYNGGKYLTAANISGLYSSTNPARRTVNQLARNWTDNDVDRVVDCDVMNFQPNGECGTFLLFIPGTFTLGNDTARFGRDPFGVAPVNLATTQCGRQSTGEPGIPDAVKAYCDAYGGNLLSGWGVRQNEWQHGIGIQHEILPRLSGEFTWNRRSYYGLTSSDQLSIGCDRFNGAQDVTACQQNYLDYLSATDDFYTVMAPLDPRLPGGGGYRILGLNTSKTTPPTSPGTAVTINPSNERTYNGFDTNFVWRGPRGFRINGGTSTGRTKRDTCFAELDNPNVRGREGREYEAGCRGNVPWTTRINGSASYVIPWVDVLVSTVFSSLPGINIGATLQYNKNDVIWNPESASRATRPCTGAAAAAGVGCLGATASDQTVNVPLLLSNEFIGERVTTFDVKFAKNIRFANKRATIGVDIYNFTNSDAITSYNGTYTATRLPDGTFVEDNPGTAAVEVNNWMQPMGVVAPRFARLSVQFSF
jgi:hypothetical protein